MAWLRFFRIVNLPTVPGDVLVGAGAVSAFASSLDAAGASRLPWAVAASCALYLYGLADNDIVGAKKDGSERPIPAGEITMGAARMARALCLAVTLAAGLCGNLPSVWWCVAFALCLSVLAYNRTKKSVLMGLCRGLNVLGGGFAVLPLFSHATGMSRPLWGVAGVALLWTAYIWAVTKYSEGEDKDPAKRQCVGFLIGALIYLQLIVLFAAYLSAPNAVTRGTLLAGAAMLIALRFLKRVLPTVSAS